MTDNFLCSGLLALMVAVAGAAGVSLVRPDHPADADPAADMPVVMLPAVVVAGKRLAPADEVATADPSVVRLPPVAVTGRRVPTMEIVTLAQRAAND
jgi:hypothetical protein